MSVSGSGPWSVTIQNSPAGYWRVRTTSTTDDLDQINFSPSASDITLIVGSHSNASQELDPTVPLTTAGCDNLNKIDSGGVTTNTLRVKAFIGGTFGTTPSDPSSNDPGGSIDVYHLMRFTANGDMIRPLLRSRSTTDPVESIDAPNGTITDKDTGPTVTSGLIESFGGTIKFVGGKNGVHVPIVVQNNGELTEVSSSSGDIGGARPLNDDDDGYRATTIEAGTIGSIIGKNIRSEITAHIGVKLIETTVAGLRGKLTTPTLLNRTLTDGGLIKAKGACTMSMDFSSEFPVNAAIRIGLSYGYDDKANMPSINPTTDLSYQPKITCPAGQFKGLVVLNASNATYPTTISGKEHRRPFLGRVEVGSNSTAIKWTSDRKNAYNLAAGTVGGGSLAVVRDLTASGYQIHTDSCTPAWTRSPSPSATPPVGLNAILPSGAGVKVRWYGPVQNVSQSGFYVQMDNGNGPVDVTSAFQLTQSATDPREVTMKLTTAA